MGLTKVDDNSDMTVQYLLFCTEPESTIKPKDILCFASRSEKMPLLGWGEDKTPMLMFIDSRQPFADGTIPVRESKLPQACTCGPTILLPIMTVTTSKRK